MVTRGVEPAIDEPIGEDPASNVRVRISRGIVKLLKDHYGRGPSRAKTYVTEDAIFVLLEGGFTQVEATLLAQGQGQAVRDQRALFQEGMRPQFIELVEQETERKVLSAMSTGDQAADMAVQVFVLEARAVTEAQATGEEPLAQ